ncbi:MAG TPA: hypothetical protein EYQ64_10205 [Gemmatimonadetes bacterium]|nr:hypothetical protein [Gemmatimonadota bacterium]
MIRRTSLAGLALLIAVPLAAQAPAGLQLRLDHSTNADDPDDVPEVTVTTQGSGYRVETGPAVTAWDSNDTAMGSYTLRGTFTMLEPSGHVNYYGLVYGGGAMEGDGQNYLYFLIGQNGTYIVKHRAGNETTHDIQARTAHDAIETPDAGGRSVNELEVRVGSNRTDFVVNGVVVYTAPKSGMAARTDGIWGVRVNHVLPGIVVSDLGVSR